MCHAYVPRVAIDTYQGSCHCGTVKFTAALDLEEPALVCNCSMCGRSGTMLMFIPLAEFTLDSGEANLTSYQFNKHVIDHLFCKTCGIKSFAYGAGPKGPMAAINARCLEGVDPSKLKIQHYDGASR